MSQHPSYELFEELGRGVNTVVYRSYDLALGREVAVKELDESGRRDPRHRERFLREAQFLAQFEHDNVLRVYSVDTERGWIIMELMKGTLASVIAAGPSDPDLVRSVLKQTLDALAFLHEKHKVHGTVRPTNLLINEAGRVKLSEFEQTDVGGELRAPKGSKKYLAPELIRPEFGDFGPPLDLYCLGFTALELLKGNQFDSLFPGTGKGAIDADLAWLRWHSSTEELASTKKLVKGIPDDLAHVLDRMLKKRVDDRPQSAQEVLKELADRPLVAVPIAGVVDEDSPAAGDRERLAPAVVRTLATPPTPAPRGGAPAATGGPAAAGQRSPSGEKTPRSSKSAAAAGKPAPPTFSKDWFNQQLGRPYVLYPLCALILLGALWYSIGINSTDDVEPVPTLVAVTFDVQPDASDVEVAVGEDRVSVAEDGSYPIEPGRHAVTFRKEGFHPVTQELDVSAEQHAFSIQLQPIIKFVDVVVRVTPPDAQLSIGGGTQTLASGSVTHKHQEDQPLVVEARRDGYVSVSRSIAPDELAKLNHQVAIELEREKPRLPDSLIAKPGAALDPDVELPVRALAARLSGDEVLELALVKPGTYSFGSAEAKRSEGELPRRSVRIDEPFYIAIHETTNAQYQRFSESAGAAQAGSRWQRASRKWAEPLKLDPLKNQLPATNMSIAEVQAFCTWIGGRLPTEIEWESAVRGEQDRGYPFPWGSGEPTRHRCQIFYGELQPVPVEQLAVGASPLGLMHAIGNAAEWCQDSERLGNFILRGCSFATANINDVRVTWRRPGDSRGEEDTGFRIVIPATGTGAAAAVVPKASDVPKTASDTTSASTANSSSNKSAEGKDNDNAGLPTSFRVVLSLPWKVVSKNLGRGE